MANQDLLLDEIGHPTVILRDNVIAHLRQNIQKKWWQCEAGGQLFARMNSREWIVELATGPRQSDFRSRFAFRPDRCAERTEIETLFANGLHYVGDWHTHAEDLPTPSGSDLKSMSDIVSKSKHSLDGFLMLIVGRSEFPKGLWASKHFRDGSYMRLPIERSQ